MRIGFVTCVALGRACIERIYEVGGHLDALFTLQDGIAVHKAGRVFLDDIARDSKAPLTKFRHINDEDALDAMRRAQLDWLLVIGWSQIANHQVLSIPRNGVLGMHPTLLPEGRGRASIPWAILKGLPQTGVTLFQLDEGVDTGPIAAQEVLPIAPDETATTLYSRVQAAHVALIARAWPDITSGGLTLTPQGAGATEWPARSPGDGQLRNDMTIAQMDRLVRAVTHPYPGAFVDRRDGSRLRVWGGRTEPGENRSESFPIEAKDGVFWAVDFEIESEA